MKAKLVVLCLFVMFAITMQMRASAGQWVITNYGPDYNTDQQDSGQDSGSWYYLPQGYWGYYSWDTEATATAEPETTNQDHCIVVVSGNANTTDLTYADRITPSAAASASFDRSIHQTWSGPEPAPTRLVSDEFQISGYEYIGLRSEAFEAITPSRCWMQAETGGWGQSACYLLPDDRYLGTIFAMKELRITKDAVIGGDTRSGDYLPSVTETNNPYVYPNTTTTTRYGYASGRQQNSEWVVSNQLSVLEGSASYRSEGSYQTSSSGNYYKNDHGEVNANAVISAYGTAVGNFYAIACVAVYSPHINN